MAYPPPLDTTAEAQKIVNFLTVTFKRTGKTKGIVAISGGIDSATSLLLSVLALTPQNVIALYLPSKSTPQINQNHIEQLIQKAGLPPRNFLTIPIHGLIQKSWRLIKRVDKSSMSRPKDARSRTPLAGVEDVLLDANTADVNQLRLANLQARIRMILLYDQAKKHDALVIGTENMSEYLLGYFTRFGDDASDLEPIRHLYKTQVIELAHHLDVPEPIIKKAPSADLWSGQTDANELGFTYTEADPIHYLHEQGKSKEEILKEGFETNLVEKVLDQVSRSEFKQQVPYRLPV